MPTFLISLLIVVLILWIIKEVLAAVSLGEPATKLIWVISIVIAILWLLFGHVGLY